MVVKASLRIQLLADSAVIAESDDQILWQRVLAAIQNGLDILPLIEPEVREGAKRDEHVDTPEESSTQGIKRVPAFARELGVSVDIVEGACGPETEAPYIHLSDHHWEALKRNSPGRGPTSIAATVMAATLLAIWFKHAGIPGGPSVAQCQAVLGTINLRDQNAAWALRNCPWLQSRNGSIVVNPAERSRAVHLAKAYCLKKSLVEQGKE